MLRYPASISSQIPSPPALTPGPQAGAQAAQEFTYKLALAASRKPQEHLCCREWSHPVWTDKQVSSKTRTAPESLVPARWLGPGRFFYGTPQQPRLLLALLSHRPIRAKDTAYPSLLATSGPHSNSLRGGNCAAVRSLIGQRRCRSLTP